MVVTSPCRIASGTKRPTAVRASNSGDKVSSLIRRVRFLHKASSDAEEIVVVEVDLDAVDTQRTHWPFFRDRRIDAYSDMGKRFIDDETP